MPAGEEGRDLVRGLGEAESPRFTVWRTELAEAGRAGPGGVGDGDPRRRRRLEGEKPVRT